MWWELGNTAWVLFEISQRTLKWTVVAVICRIGTFWREFPHLSQDCEYFAVCEKNMVFRQNGNATHPQHSTSKYADMCTSTVKLGMSIGL